MVTIEKRADFYEKRCVEQANALGWCELEIRENDFSLPLSIEDILDNMEE